MSQRRTHPAHTAAMTASVTTKAAMSSRGADVDRRMAAVNGSRPPQGRHHRRPGRGAQGPFRAFRPAWTTRGAQTGGTRHEVGVVSPPGWSHTDAHVHLHDPDLLPPLWPRIAVRRPPAAIPAGRGPNHHHAAAVSHASRVRSARAASLRDERSAAAPRGATAGGAAPRVRPPSLPPQSGPLGAFARGSRPLRCEASLVSLARTRAADGERRGGRAPAFRVSRTLHTAGL